MYKTLPLFSTTCGANVKFVLGGVTRGWTTSLPKSKGICSVFISQSCTCCWIQLWAVGVVKTTVCINAKYSWGWLALEVSYHELCWASGKSNLLVARDEMGIIKVSGIHYLGSMNVCPKFHGNPPIVKSCWENSFGPSCKWTFQSLEVQCMLL